MNSFNQIKELLNFSYKSEESTANDPILFHVNRAGCSCCDSEFEITRDNTYPYYTIHLLFDGCGFFHIAGQNYFLTKGDAFIITPGQAHNYCSFTSDSMGLIWIEVSGILCQELFNVLKTNEVYTIRKTSDYILTQNLIDLLLYLKNTDEKNPYEISAKVYTFFMCLFNQVNNSVTKNPPRLFSQSLDYIHLHLYENLLVTDIAEHLKISTTYLNRLFHKYAGTSISQYIKLKRIESAMSLLADTDLTCEAISEKIGLYDASYFHKVFKSITGKTPLQYRKLNNKHIGL